MDKNKNKIITLKVSEKELKKIKKFSKKHYDGNVSQFIRCSMESKMTNVEAVKNARY